LLKVLVTGPFSTGKSTLVDSLAAMLRPRYSVALVPDVARQCPFAINRHQEEEGTLWLLTKQVSAELENSLQRPDVLLCDRGVPDICAHLEEARTRGAALARADLLKPFLIEWCRTYELVLVSRVDSGIPVLDDHVRELDQGFRAEMEAFSDLVLAQFAPNAKKLPQSPDEPLAIALTLIESRLDRKWG
jgi:energy-coupling factor transporter ATP-binding protein EcfA2